MAAKIRFWETREFRWLVLILIMAAATLAVLVFEIVPLMKSRERRDAVRVQEGIEAILPGEKGAAVDPRDPRLTSQLAGVEDHSTLEQSSPQYCALVDHLRQIAPDALAKEARTVEHPLFARAPDTLRGRAVRIKALYLDSFTIALEKKVGEVEFVYRAFLADPSGNEGYVIDYIAPLPYLDKKTPVETEACFFKIGTYEGKRGMKANPHFIGRGLRVLPEPLAAAGDDAATWYIGAMLALCLFLLTAWVFLQWHLTRRSRLRRLPGSTPPPVPRV